MAPGISCRNPDHISHIWPMLQLQSDIEILRCEKICQWCPISNEKVWETATALRKHARRHLKGSAFNIRSAGVGGRQPLAKQAQYLNPRQIYEARLESAIQIDAAHSVYHRVIPQFQGQDSSLVCSTATEAVPSSVQPERPSLSLIDPALDQSTASSLPVPGSVLSNADPSRKAFSNQLVANESAASVKKKPQKTKKVALGARKQKLFRKRVQKK